MASKEIKETAEYILKFGMHEGKKVVLRRPSAGSRNHARFIAMKEAGANASIAAVVIRVYEVMLPYCVKQGPWMGDTSAVDKVVTNLDRLDPRDYDGIMESFHEIYSLEEESDIKKSEKPSEKTIKEPMKELSEEIQE